MSKMIDPLGFIIIFFLSFWWILFPLLLSQIIWEKFLDNQASQFIQKNFNYTFFEIIFPENDLKTPKLMENVFINLHAGASTVKTMEELIGGKTLFPYILLMWFHERKIKFFIGTPTSQKNFVKSSFSTSYPLLNLRETENPWKKINFSVPNQIYDNLILLISLRNNDMIPIKTYDLLEKLEPEERFDPAIGFWELKENISNRENLVLIITALPVLGNDKKFGGAWLSRAQATIDSIMGKPPPPRTITFRERIEEFLINFLKAIYTYPQWKSLEAPKPFEFNIQKLTPQQRELIEAIQNKMKKPGYLCFIKAVYFASKEILNKKKTEIRLSLQGSLNYFSIENFNGFTLKSPYSVSKNETLSEFKEFLMKFSQFNKSKNLGDVAIGKNWFILNATELATIFHHPLENFPGIERTNEKGINLPEIPLV